MTAFGLLCTSLITAPLRHRVLFVHEFEHLRNYPIVSCDRRLPGFPNIEIYISVFTLICTKSDLVNCLRDIIDRNAVKLCRITITLADQFCRIAAPYVEGRSLRVVSCMDGPFCRTIPMEIDIRLRATSNGKCKKKNAHKIRWVNRLGVISQVSNHIHLHRLV